MKHPEDREDWGQWASDPSNWQRPEEHAAEEDASRPSRLNAAEGGEGEATGDPSDALEDRGIIRREEGPEGTGPYNLGPGEIDDRDPLPPRGSTPYTETSPWTNRHAWRYQSQPYEEDAGTTRSGCGGIVGMAVLLAVALIALGLFLQ